MKLNDFIDNTKQEISNYFNDFSKDDVIKFCKDNDIPYKKYFSKNKLLEQTIDFVDSTMMFKRIGRI